MRFPPPFLICALVCPIDPAISRRKQAALAFADWQPKSGYRGAPSRKGSWLQLKGEDYFLVARRFDRIRASLATTLSARATRRGRRPIPRGKKEIKTRYNSNGLASGIPTDRP
jgi:hypothetical protein